MAYIEKRALPNGKITYRARIRIHGMPELSATFHKSSHAKEWALKKEAELKISRYFPRDEGKNHTFATFADLYITKVLPKNPKAFTKQKNFILWWKSKLGSYFLSHISPSMIAELRDELLAQKTLRKKLRTPSTVNRYLAALSRAFTSCIKELGWIKENPVLSIQRPKENKSRERFLTKEEIVKLLTECKRSRSPHLYPVVLFALATGARQGEILHLKWEDVDIVYGIAIFRDTKNGESRSVALSHPIIDSLKQERRKRYVLSPSMSFPISTANNRLIFQLHGNRLSNEQACAMSVFTTFGTPQRPISLCPALPPLKSQPFSVTKPLLWSNAIAI